MPFPAPNRLSTLIQEEIEFRRLMHSFLQSLTDKPYDSPMSDTTGYDELLQATIEHLQGLKSRGVRYVPVDPETLQSLARPLPQPRRPATTASPKSPSAARAREVAPPAPPAPPVRPSVPVPPASAPASSGPDLMGGDQQTDVGSSQPALQGSAKVQAMEELRERALVCTKCAHLVSSRTNVVFGVGNMDTDLMFVGEAPGADEDIQGEPFVGKAGELLTRIIQTMGLQRGEVYIANILKCRPDTPGKRSGNRKPTPEEMQTCIPYLHEQIDLIRPKVLVALGATAVEGLLGKTPGITRLRGNWQTYRGIPMMPTYHPAYLLRNQSHTEKRKVWEDMLMVMEKLGMAITEKQRGFFLKAN